MQQEQPREDLAPWFLTLDDLDGQADWNCLFQNDHPVELDVGCGRGLFLFNESLAHPERNYLGIEIDYREGRRTAKRLKKRQAPNARVWGGDARAALERHIRPASIATVHVYFPDPWWKRKHRRRRVFTDAFVDQVVRILEPGGLLVSATDVPEYFETIAGLLNNDPRFDPLVPGTLPGGEHDLDYLTSFDRKARQQGKPIHHGRWQLRPTTK